MFFSQLGHIHHLHHDLLALSSLSDPLTSSPSSSSSSTSSDVYNPWHDASYIPALQSAFHQFPSPASHSIRRSFDNLTYQPLQDDRSCNSRLVPMLPYSTPADPSFARRNSFTPQTPFPLSPSPRQHIPTANNDPIDDRSSRSFFDPIYPSPSYTLSAAISSAPATPPTASPSVPPSAPPPSLPPPPPRSSASPYSSPSPSPPSSPDSKSFHPPPLPSVHAFRLDTLQSVDPSDDPCPLSLNDLMIPSEEQEYQGHSYHFSLQSVSPSKPRPESFPDEKQQAHDETGVPKRKGKSKMHTCTLCQKSFPRPSGLRTHMNSHSGDKPYRCPVTSCSKSFTVRSNAKRHIRTHGIHLPFPQAADTASLTGGDSGLVPADKDPQRALRIRWVGQNLDEHPDGHSNGQPSNPQGGACIGDLTDDGNVDDDDFGTSRLEGVFNQVDPYEGSFGSASRSDLRSRKYPQKHSSHCSSVLAKKVV